MPRLAHVFEQRMQALIHLSLARELSAFESDQQWPPARDSAALILKACAERYSSKGVNEGYPASWTR